MNSAPGDPGLRHLVVDTFADRKFRLRGTGRWAKPGDSWLCTHDILHHSPVDRGHIHQELMTFGAEVWMNMNGEGLHSIDPTAVSGSLLDGIPERIHTLNNATAPPSSASPKTAALLSRLVVPAPRLSLIRPHFRAHRVRPIHRFDALPENHPLAVPEPDAITGSRVKSDLDADALWDHLMLVADWAFDDIVSSLRINDIALTADWPVRLAGDDNKRRAAQWMAIGHRLAQRRYPNPQHLRRLFADLMALLQKRETKRGGETIRFSICEREGVLVSNSR